MRFSPFGFVARERDSRLCLAKLTEALGALGATRFCATVVFGNPHSDPENPRAQLRTPLEARPTSMNDQEHVLHGVVDERPGDPQAPQATPHELKVLRAGGAK